MWGRLADRRPRVTARSDRLASRALMSRGCASRFWSSSPEPSMFPSESDLTICFAHVAYQLQQRFALRKLPIRNFGVASHDELEVRIGEADVLVISGVWRNELVARAPKLRFIQSIGAGTDQFDRVVLKKRGIRLASAQGVNVNAVSEHVMSLILALARRLPEARDNQAKHVWRGMISDLTQREDELGGKTLLVVGL